MIKLISFDIDGTLIGEDKVFSDYTRRVLLALRERGIRLAIASGRQISIYKAQVDSWNCPFDLYIGLNGAESLDTSDGVYESFYKLRYADLKEIVDLMADYVDHHYYKQSDIIRYDDDLTSFLARLSKDVTEIEDIYAMDIEEIGKLQYYFKDIDEVEKVERYIEDAINSLGKGYHGFRTHPNYLEFSDRRTSKAVPLIAYAKRYDIDMSDVMSFGDTTNDDTMLEVSGVGVCLLNGTDDTKAIADIVTEYDNEHEGAAKFLVSYFDLDIPHQKAP